MKDIGTIVIENLSKKYRLGGGTDLSKTLREILSSLPKSIVSTFKKRQTVSGFRVGQEGGCFYALKDICLYIEPGEVVGIIGRNGSGKTTLLKLLSRVTPPTAGVIDIYGRVGALLEVGTGFHPELTGRENIYLSGAILGMRKRDIRRLFDEIVDFAGISDFVDTPVKRYSSGMIMRLGFSVAAHLDTDILLVDELLSVGDTSFQNRCLGKIESISRDGRTVLIVSHNMHAVTRLCSRVIRLETGRLFADGVPASTVSDYLSDVSSLSPYFETSPVSGLDAQIVRVSIETDVGPVSPEVSRDSSFSVVIDIDADRDIPDGFLTLTLCDAVGESLLTADQRDGAETMDDCGFERGRMRVTILFPARLLSVGHYICTIRALSIGGGLLHEVDKCLSFTIVSSEHLNHIGQVGFFTPSLTWHRAM